MRRDIRPSPLNTPALKSHCHHPGGGGDRKKTPPPTHGNLNFPTPGTPRVVHPSTKRFKLSAGCREPPRRDKHPPQPHPLRSGAAVGQGRGEDPGWEGWREGWEQRGGCWKGHAAATGSVLAAASPSRTSLQLRRNLSALGVRQHREFIIGPCWLQH